MLALVTAVLYWPAAGGGFVNFDDDLYVTGNVPVRSGLTWEGIKWACLNPVADVWHPLTIWSHMLVCQVGGLSPWGHHLVNVLLHALNAGLVFVLLQLMTRATWRSLCVAALFAVHPLRVESVAWVSERKDVLSTCFGLLCLWAYVRYVQSPESRVQSLQSEKPVQSSKFKVQSPLTTLHAPRSPLFWYVLSLVFFTLGLMSKPMLVTWPFVMLLLDYWPLRRLEPRLDAPRSTPMRPVIEKIPFFALAALMSVVTYVVQQQQGAVTGAQNLPLGARGANALVSYGRYLGKLFWPTDLAVFYPHPGHWPLGVVMLAGGLLLGVSGVFWALRQRYPFFLVGWLWFLGTLVPVIGLIQVGGQSMADRYTYFPHIGVLILAVWGACELTRTWRYQALALSLAASVAVVFCVILTRQQIACWRDSEALFRHALEVTQNNALAHNNLGIALGEQGQLDEALHEYEEAIRLEPGYALAHNNLGLAFVGKGQRNEAIGQFQEAIRLKPGYADAHNNLGLVLGEEGQTDEALRQFQEAVRLQPDYAKARGNLGNVLAMKGQKDEALRQFQEAVRLSPDYAEAHNNLGIALAVKGQRREAVRQFQEAIRLKPDYAEAHNNLGIALVGTGQRDEAIRQFQEAVRLKPDYAEARKSLEILLGTKTDASQPPGPPTNR
jgi:tetratricopeptide (TPR) repeat protein